jgi:hypothetical protein
MTLVKKKGKSPHKKRSMEERVRQGRIRGSRPDEILRGIYEKGAVFKCPITDEDPAKYFMQHREIWIPRRMHHPIPYSQLVKMGVKDPNSVQYVMFGSPNGHNMLDNYMNGIVTMNKSDVQICKICKLNTWDMFEKHKKVLKLESHHEDCMFTTWDLCPTCHAATESHSVNDGKVPFPAKEFAELILDKNIIDLTSLHNTLKKYSPKIQKNTIQYKFYGMGLHRFFDTKLMPVPFILRKYFPNKNFDKFFI